MMAEEWEGASASADSKVVWKSCWASLGAMRRQDLDARIPWNRSLLWLPVGLFELVSVMRVFAARSGDVNVESWRLKVMQEVQPPHLWIQLGGYSP